MKDDIIRNMCSTFAKDISKLEILVHEAIWKMFMNDWMWAVFT